MLSQKSVQQYESCVQTALTQPLGSQPGESADESSHKLCEHVPCGGTPLACAWHAPFMHVCVVVHMVPHLPQLFESVMRS